MAGRRSVRKRTHLSAPGYPSFLEHRADRRQFLLLGLAGLGAAAFAACEGSEEPDNINVNTGYNFNTSGVNVNNNWPTVNTNSDASVASYDSVHFPSSGDRTVTLDDGGTLRWSATAVTHSDSAAQYGVSYNEELTTKLSVALAGYTSDVLSTNDGVFDAAATLRELINVAYADHFSELNAVPFESLDLYVIDLVSP